MDVKLRRGETHAAELIRTGVLGIKEKRCAEMAVFNGVETAQGWHGCFSSFGGSRGKQSVLGDVEPLKQCSPGDGG